MPFTPFHMGPGLLFKGLLQGSFSLLIFGWTQVVMDVQPLVVLITGEGHLHGFSHTFTGATLLALVSALTGKYAAEAGLRVLAAFPESFQQVSSVISWWVVLLSAFSGSYSHVLLDAVMHGDLQPFYPFNTDNPWLLLLSVEALHQLCLYSGIAGMSLWILIMRLRLKWQ